jgi:uncharacterized protein (DUF58 family)
VKRQGRLLLRYFEASKFRFSRNSLWARTWRACSSRRLLPFSFGITRQGVLYIFCVALLGLIAIGDGNNLLYVILAALISAIAVSGVVSKNSLKQISLSLQLPENVFVGERVFVKISMKNTKRIFPSFSIRAEDPAMSRRHSPFAIFRKAPFFFRKATDIAEPQDTAVLRQSAYFPILRAGETRSELVVQSFPKRGMYTLDGFWISTRFPFGFFRRGQRIGAKGDVLVYPLIQKVPAFFQMLPFLPGLLEGNRVGPGENLFSMRKYQEGETSRIIDWKATSKTGELMAREFARDEESKFCLILDTRIHAPVLDNQKNFEKAVSFAASIAAHFLEEGAGMEFLTPEEYLPRGAGRNHLYRILRLLAVVQCRKAAASTAGELWERPSFPGIQNVQALQQVLSDKIYKIIITSQPRRSFPSIIWRSSHVVYFDEL